MQFLLIHQYAGNKGDRAVLLAMVTMLRKQFENCKIVVSTSHPELWTEKDFSDTDVSFVPSAWDFKRAKGPWFKVLQSVHKYTFTILRECYLKNIRMGRLLANPKFFKALKASDIVLSVGGHHFTTILSKDLVCSINYDAAVATSYRPTVCFSQSFGPFEFTNPKNRLFTQRILNKCRLLMPREDNSRRELNAFGANGIMPTNESVITLGNVVPEFTPADERAARIGIAIYCAQRREADEREKYIQCIADFCDHAIKLGYEVSFFPMEIKGTPPDDRGMIREIIERTHDGRKVSFHDEDMTSADHIREVAKCRVFVGHKTHSTIFALATGTPLVGIAYHPKTQEFMEQFGVGQYAIDDKKLSADILIATFDRLDANVSDVSRSLHHRSEELSARIQNDLHNAIAQTISRQ